MEDVVLNRRDDAVERLMEFAEKTKSEKTTETHHTKTEKWRNLPVNERLVYALVKGIDTYLEEDLAEARCV